jgi:lipopolysaccharide transport system ATP-binding protein
MSSAIDVENISKKYVIDHRTAGSYLTLRDTLAAKMSGLIDKFTGLPGVPKSDPTHEEFWALENVSFNIQAGERVGIIGGNGAGKSTLLKILSRITEPSSGRVKIRGRVSSLLEVGTGFHPELTGRENIYLNGAILGMSKIEIKGKFDEIVAFSEVEKFLDTPVKRYSSGMYVRLAFSVAAHLEPEILIVDEVLAVGDAQFQKKCLGKMESAGREGRTILFVSHNVAAIKELCSKAVFLHKGRVAFSGGVEEAIHEYLGPKVLMRNEIFWGEGVDSPGNNYIGLRSIQIIPRHGELITIDSGIEISIVFFNKTEGLCLGITLRIYTVDGVCVLETGIVLTTNDCTNTGEITAKCLVPSNLLNAGVYKINLAFGNRAKENPNAPYMIYSIEDLILFEVDHTITGRSHSGKALGVIRPLLDWSYEYK